MLAVQLIDLLYNIVPCKQSPLETHMCTLTTLLRSSLLLLSSQVNVAGRASKVGTPVVFVRRILLIHIDLEELVVRCTSVIFVARHVSNFQSMGKSVCALQDSRVQLLKVDVDQSLLSDLDKLGTIALNRDKIPLRLERTVIDLFDKLDSKGRRVVGHDVTGSGGLAARILCPGHKGRKLVLVTQAGGFVGRDGAAAKEGRHNCACGKLRMA